MAYYTKKDLTNIGLEGFALIDEFYGRKPRGHATCKVTSRPLPPPPPPPPAAVAATPVVASNYYSTASSSGRYSRRTHQYQGYNYRYSPAESHVGWTPVVAMTAETTTVIRGGYEAGKLHDGDILMDNYKY